MIFRGSQKRKEVNIMGEKVVYETKGAGKRWVAWIIFSALCLAMAVGCFILREMKNEVSTLRSGYMGSDGQIHWTDERSGYWNGQVYVLTEDGRQTALVLGIVFSFLWAFYLDLGIGMHRCWLQVYETYAEGQRFSLGLSKNVFHYSAAQIESIKQINGAVTIKAGQEVHVIMCKDPNVAFQTLNEWSQQAAKI